MIHTNHFMSLVTATLLASTLGFASTANAQSLSLLDHLLLGVGEGEILSYTTDMNLVGATSGIGARMFMIDGSGQISATGISAQFAGFDSATSVVLSDRGYGIVSLLPEGDTTAATGSVGFFDYKTGALLGTVGVGYHPDSVKLSADGNTLFIADEGEHGTNDVTGSISKIDLTGATTATNFALLSSTTVDFSDANVAPAAQAQRDDLRNNNPGVDVSLAIEPEFMAFRADGRLLVSLQEANAIGVFNPDTNTWEAFHNLGTITQTVDASDQDGPGETPSAMIDDVVAGMPMPDSIASFSVAGKNFVVTANEGDFRPDDFERTRVKDLEDDGFAIDDATEATLDGIYGDFDSDLYLGRLRVSNIDGDTDGDGDIDVLTMPGTRSFSIWDADTGALVADSGSLENFLLGNDPLLHNIDDGDLAEFDQRSDDKGPEPEGIDILMTPNGDVFVAVGLERQNGLVLAKLDLTDAASGIIGIELVDYINNLSLGMISPESLLWIDGVDSPTGRAILLVGYEGIGDGVGNAIGIYSIPEPTTAVLSLGGLLALAAHRRRRVA